ncbi:MAG: tRNA (adenosine(37)-N6)-threonylcarbamoyltransferase complex ATPase subunit type 1 TsaE [Bacteroidia bacterium]|nr:tRNA (adenosine(37)-N6)-threonylcarbamoyltransferase complex ATPase subunit type 1 TsaE [Bacteroidia bacterium]
MAKTYSRCFSLEELPEVIRDLRAWAPHVACWLLYGPMGSGKTTLVRAWLGEDVSSPTFTYIHRYPTGIHVDLYRFPTESPSRWNELYTLMEESSLIFIEWAEKLPFSPPSPWVEVRLSLKGENHRCLLALLRIDQG